MTSRVIVVLALIIGMATFGSAKTAPQEDRTKVLSDIATRLGQVVGAAYACADIPKIRINTARERIGETLKTEGASQANASSPAQIFEANIVLGFQNAFKRQSDCAAVERDLTSLEQIYKSNSEPKPVEKDIQVRSPVVTASKSPGVALGIMRGFTDNEIRFGIAAPFTGPSKKLGMQMKIGIETAFHEANDAGGVQGRQLKLYSSDDAYEPSRTLDAMKELCEFYDVFAFIGNVGTPTAAVALPYALDRRMTFFAAFTGANLLRNEPPDRYVFNYRASYSEETDAAVNYLVTTRGIKPEEIAVFAQDDSFGDAGYAGVTLAVQKLKESKRGVVLRLSYKRNTDDVEKAVSDLTAYKKPIKAIVMVATYRPAAKFIQRTRAAFPNLIYTNVSFVGSTALRDELKQLNVKSLKDIIVTQVVPPVEGYSALVLHYKAELSRYFPTETPDYVSLEGYIAARIMIDALNRTGPQIDSEKLVDTMENSHDVDIGLGFTMTFSKEEHQGSHKVWATQLSETGEYEIIKLQQQ
jgi:ABC-type branched-subunit amino acid transport system substrate-binding protein